MIELPAPEAIEEAAVRMNGVLATTPLELDESLSREFDARVYLKREDLQITRSYKVRGAFNRLQAALPNELGRGVACASAGNHGQGVAWAARRRGVTARVFMPRNTSEQKIGRVRALGGDSVEVVLVGETFDLCSIEAIGEAERSGALFVHPFEDPLVIEGQGTIACEILEDAPEPVDRIFIPVGGGGLASGIGSYLRYRSPSTRIIGVEPEGAPSMREALRTGRPVALKRMDGFADGAAVGTVGARTFEICRKVLHEVMTVPEGRLAAMILALYEERGMVVEPAGTLAMSALEQARQEIRGETVVCVVSGGNNDFRRTNEIRERALRYTPALSQNPAPSGPAPTGSP